MYTFPQIILNVAGNSYLGRSSKYLSHNSLQYKLQELLHNKPVRNNYYVFEIIGNDAILRAAQTSIKGAIYYFNNGNNSNRLIVHFDNSFFSIPNHIKLLSKPEKPYCLVGFTFCCYSYIA